MSHFAARTAAQRGELFCGPLDSQGHNLTYGPTAIPLRLAFNSRNEKRIEDAAGFIPVADAIAHLPAAVAKSKGITPAPGDRVTYTPTGAQYRVAVINQDPVSGTYRLELALILNV